MSKMKELVEKQVLIGRVSARPSRKYILAFNYYDAREAAKTLNFLPAEWFRYDDMSKIAGLGSVKVYVTERASEHFDYEKLLANARIRRCEIIFMEGEEDGNRA